MGAYLAVMMHAFRICLGLFLALTVALTAHSAAARQGERDAAGQMVICTGTGPVTIYVDSEGQPAKPPHSCPDCVMHVLDAVAQPAGLVLPVELCGSVTAGRQAIPPSIQHILNASARAPPSYA
ncbi:hypothetical protein [Leisingera sp. JC11]|uniref:hypothetical protein n=1 Tax=Leisingera sp. JC11 TaxID=3042469 RepID=UPI003452AAB5